MDNDSSKDKIELFEEEKILSNLDELKKYLSSELSELGELSKKAFTPITDGLGLESPLRKEPEPQTEKEFKRTGIPSGEKVLNDIYSPPNETFNRLSEFILEPEITIESQADSQPLSDSEKLTESKVSSEELQLTEKETISDLKSPKEMALDSQKFNETPVTESHKVILRPEIKELIEVKKEEEQVVLRHKERVEAIPQVPEIPLPSRMRRFFAGLVDHIFVSLLCVTLLISGIVFFNGLDATNISIAFSLKLMLICFLTLWFSYFVICIGILNMTFGMWVWGLKINYGSLPTKYVGLKKFLRIFFSFIFIVPIFPSFILLITKKGRNLIDFLSFSSLHRTSL